MVTTGGGQAKDHAESPVIGKPERIRPDAPVAGPATNDPRLAEDWLGQANALREAGKRKKAVDIYTCLIDGFGDDPVSAIREQAAKALVGRGVAYGQLDSSIDAQADYKRLISDYSEDHDSEIRRYVKEAKTKYPKHWWQ